MVRTYVRKGTGPKWTEEDINQAISSVLRGDVSMRGAAALFKVPYSTLKDRVHAHRRQKAIGEKLETRTVGHPTVFSLEEERDLVSRLKSLAVRGFGCTPEQIRKAAFVYATTKNIRHPWSSETKSAGKDWFTGFM